MNQVLQEIYQKHHQEKGKANFSIMKDLRAKMFSHYIGQDKEVLDLGCRDGALTSFFLEKNKVTGADIDRNLLALAEQKGISPVFMDLNGPWDQLAGKKFDVVVAGEILEHLYYPAEVARKVTEHLKPGGLFIGTVPNAFSLKNRWRYLKAQKKHTPLEDPTHINHFSSAELKQVLSKYYRQVEILGLGRYERLAKLNPNLFAFNLMFICTL